MKNLMASITLLLVTSVLFLVSCEKDCLHPEPVKYPVYFQFDAKNYAWGLYHGGWYVDENGKFKAYNLPSVWREPDSLGYISKEELLANLEMADSILYQVSLTELGNEINLIDQVDDKSFSEIQHVGADIGVQYLYCFSWDKDKAKYKRILLAMGGDFRQYNLDPEAQELVAWLKAIGENGGFFSWY